LQRLALFITALALISLPSEAGSSSALFSTTLQPTPFWPNSALDGEGKEQTGSKSRRHEPRQTIDSASNSGVVRTIVLTFDDGPDQETTPIVLAELKKRGIKAVFFVAARRLIAGGSRGRRQRALLRQMIREGHTVANHTVNHIHLCEHPERMAAEIDGNDQILEELLGFKPRLFRSPFGDSCEALDQALASRGLVNAGWTIDPQDWRRTDPEAVAGYVIRKLENLPERGVVLLHDTRRAGVVALPKILDFIEAENRRARKGYARPIAIRGEQELLSHPSGYGAPSHTHAVAGDSENAIDAEKTPLPAANQTDPISQTGQLALRRVGRTLRSTTRALPSAKTILGTLGL